MKEYYLVQFGYQEVLFTSNGYLDEISWEEMKLYQLINSSQGIHILKISAEVTFLFGKDRSFHDWLVSKGVESEQHQLKYYSVHEPKDRFQKMIGTLEDKDWFFEFEASYLRNFCIGTIKSRGEDAQVIDEFHITDSGYFPRLDDLDVAVPKVVWTEEGSDGNLPVNVAEYFNRQKRGRRKILLME